MVKKVESHKGITRRDFLKMAGAIAAAYGLSKYCIPELAQALEKGLTEHPVIWLQGGTCTGCTVAIANSVDPSIKKILLDPIVPGNKLSVKYHCTLMQAAGDLAISMIEKTHKEAKGKFVLIVEGEIPTKDDGIYCAIGEKKEKPITMLEWMKTLGPDALAVISLGTCAAYGGVPAAKPNPTGAKGVSSVFEELGIKTPVVNIPGCPPHPDWLVLTVANILTKGLPKADELDSNGRPKAIFGTLIHEKCDRLKYFEKSQMATKFGEEGCLMQLGCKGPMTYADCPTRLWNNKRNWCVGSGGICIGCVEPDFPDGKSPLYSKLPEEMIEKLILEAKAKLGKEVIGIG